MISSSGAMLANVAVALIVCNVVLMAVAQKDPAIIELRKNFIRLTDYLEDKLPDNEEPEANLAVVNKLTDQTMSKKNISQAVGIFKSVANANECNALLFHGIKDVTLGTQAQYPETTRRSDKVLRTFIDKLLKKCDSYHEQAFKEGLSKLPTSDRSNVERIFDDQYMDNYKINNRNQLTFSIRSTPIGLPTSPLAKAVWMAAKDDPKNTITLRENPEDEGRRRIDRASVEYLFENYLFNACKKYVEAMEDVFDFGEVASICTKGEDIAFLSTRSDDYKKGLIRFHFCKDLIQEPEDAIADGVSDFSFSL